MTAVCGGICQMMMAATMTKMMETCDRQHGKQWRHDDSSSKNDRDNDHSGSGGGQMTETTK